MIYRSIHFCRSARAFPYNNRGWCSGVLVHSLPGAFWAAGAPFVGGAPGPVALVAAAPRPPATTAAVIGLVVVPRRGAPWRAPLLGLHLSRSYRQNTLTSNLGLNKKGEIFYHQVCACLAVTSRYENLPCSDIVSGRVYLDVRWIDQPTSLPSGL